MDKWLLNSSGGSCLLTIGSGPNMDLPREVIDAKEVEEYLEEIIKMLEYLFKNQDRSISVRNECVELCQKFRYIKEDIKINE